MIQLVVEKYLLGFPQHYRKNPNTLKEWLDFLVEESDSYIWEIKACDINKSYSVWEKHALDMKINDLFIL